jgi:hypothetical protein
MEEHFCTFINSVGFQKSCKDNIVYIRSDDLSKVYKSLNRTSKFVLVSGCSDYTNPTDIFPNLNAFIEFIEQPNLIKWFVQNNMYAHPKIINLPIGLDYHTLNSNTPLYWGPNMKPTDQEKELITIQQSAKPFYERQLLIYSTCHFLTTTKFGKDRMNAIQTIPRELLYLEKNKVSRLDSWKNQIHYAFVLSPHGNGLDCHRTWEALVLGCITIVKKSSIDSLYSGLPVLIVNDWNEISEPFLKETIHKYKDIVFDYDKLTLKYWMDKMNYNLHG